MTDYELRAGYDRKNKLGRIGIVPPPSPDDIQHLASMRSADAVTMRLLGNSLGTEVEFGTPFSEMVRLVADDISSRLLDLGHTVLTNSDVLQLEAGQHMVPDEQ